MVCVKDILRASYDRSAPGYDAEFRPLQRAKYEALLGPGAAHIAADLAGGPGRSRALDLGCGTGLLAEWLDEAKVLRAGLVGLDLSAAMVARACGRGLPAVQGDLERLPFRPGSFGAVLAFTSIGILPGSHGRALGEVARVLAPRGRLAVTVLASTGWRAFEAALRAAGFSPGARRDCGQDFGYLCSRI